MTLDMKKKKIAVIGAGIAGLMSIKSLKEEPNLEPICFEKTPEIGGTWYYRPDGVKGLSSIMPTTIINHSKEIGSLSNYPFPSECPNYLRHFELLEYFQSMANHFDLVRHIHFRKEVVFVEKTHDYDNTGQWKLSVKDLNTDEIATNIYDGVLVCTGQFTYPKEVSFTGMDRFRGQIIHTHDLKEVSKFSGKKVVVVGTGCSAMDAAVELSNVAHQVYLSVRTPSWIMPRCGLHGLPLDYFILRRYIMLIQDILPMRWTSILFEQGVLNLYFNHRLYGMDPKYPILARVPLINDALPSKLLSGSIKLRKDIAEFQEEGVIFQMDTEITKVDLIVLGTGYVLRYPFLEDGILRIEKGRLDLYKCVYPAQLPHPTLAFIGLFLPLGPGFPIGEMQARWAAHLLSGKGHLPSRKYMMLDVDTRHRINSERYAPSDKTTVHVDYIPYMDEIASEFGTKPNFCKMFFKDPRLFFSCVFGPFLPFQYRLEGPHAWVGARDAILNSGSRLKAPLNKDYGKGFKGSSIFIIVQCIIIFLVVITVLLL